MTLTIKDDFDLDKIVNSGQCFRPVLLEDGYYRFIYLDNVLYIKPVEEETYEVSCSKVQWESIWHHYFDLDRNYKKVRKSISKDDEFLSEASKIGKGIRILNQDPFEMLISFIISQRKSIPAIRSSIEKFCDYYGKEIKTDRELLKLFPMPQDVVKKGFSDLEKCSLGYRLPYITEAIESVASGGIDLEGLREKSEDALLEELMSIKGVGIKVASCIALFAYGCGGIAPVDTWINKCIDTYYGGISPFPAYGQNSGIYQQYFFFYMISKKG